jgi:hypothetical protein
MVWCETTNPNDRFKSVSVIVQEADVSLILSAIIPCGMSAPRVPNIFTKL